MAAPPRDAPGANPDTIPQVHSTSLTGVSIDLPGMLSGKVGILVLGFSRDSREPVAAWGRRLAAEFRTSATVNYYEMPMLAEVPKLLRGVVIRSMKKDVPDRAQARLVPILDDEERWKTLTAYDKGDDAYILVVDSTGAVRWRTHGPATDAVFAEIRNQVALARPTPATPHP